MTTPTDYKKRYENLQISLKTGGPIGVSVTKYRATFMGTGGMAVNKAAMDAFEGKLYDFAKKALPSDTPLKVDFRLRPLRSHGRQCKQALHTGLSQCVPRPESCLSGKGLA